MARGLCCFLLLAFASVAQAAEVVWLDGRRETVRRVVVKADRVLVSFEKGMRSIPKRRLVKLVGDDGKPIAFERKLVDGPLGDQDQAALAMIPEAPPDRLPSVQERLADSLSRTVLERLVALAGAKKPELRARAATTLLLMGVDESIRAGLSVAVGDKDKAVRRRLASTLPQIAGALELCGSRDEVAKGLADKDSYARAAFALALGRLGDERAIPILKRDGIKHRDHHVRESAAEALAELGDDAGVKVLVSMLTRTRHPAGDSLPERLFVQEKVRVCGHLAKLRAKGAVPALKRAARSKNAELAKAARAALDAIDG